VQSEADAGGLLNLGVGYGQVHPGRPARLRAGSHERRAFGGLREPDGGPSRSCAVGPASHSPRRAPLDR
jgi:hypothetical protein